MVDSTPSAKKGDLARPERGVKGGGKNLRPPTGKIVRLLHRGRDAGFHPALHAAMSHEFSVKVDSAMMKRAWNTWHFGSDRRRANIFVFVLFVILASMQWFVRQGPGGLTVVCLGLPAAHILLYFAGRRRSLSRLEGIGDGGAVYRLSNDSIVAESPPGSIGLRWEAVEELRRYGDSVLIGFRGALHSALPIAQIPQTALAFMRERCRSAGVRISGF